MNTKVIIALLMLVLFSGLAFAETGLKAEVDKTRLKLGESLTYKLIITSTEKDLPEPRLPDFKGFSILSQAQTSDISLTSGKIKAQAVYVFILLSEMAGKLQIEPATISVKGGRLFSQAFEIEVAPGKTKIETRPKEAPSTPETPPETEDNLPEDSEITI